MPRTPARDDYFAQSFRFTPEQAATIKEEAKRLGSTTAFVRELIDPQRSPNTGQTRSPEIRPTHGFPFKRKALRWPEDAYDWG